MAAVTRIGDGVYRVEIEGRSEMVYVAGPPHDRWAFWNGRVFRANITSGSPPSRARGHRSTAKQTLSAPMPATVLGVHAKPGAAVQKGEVLVLLEAMKMELPVRAPGDAVVAAVLCSTGELVQADQALVELE